MLGSWALGYKKSLAVYWKYGLPLLRSTAWYLKARRGEVFQVGCLKHGQEGVKESWNGLRNAQITTVTYETTWRWVQSRYHSVRLQQGRVTSWAPGKLRVALQLRRGDRPEACPLYLYLRLVDLRQRVCAPRNALRSLAELFPWMGLDNIQILVIGELDGSFQEIRRFGNRMGIVVAEEFQGLRHLNVKYLAKEKDQAEALVKAQLPDSSRAVKGHGSRGYSGDSYHRWWRILPCPRRRVGGGRRGATCAH